MARTKRGGKAPKADKQRKRQQALGSLVSAASQDPFGVELVAAADSPAGKGKLLAYLGSILDASLHDYPDLVSDFFKQAAGDPSLPAPFLCALEQCAKHRKKRRQNHRDAVSAIGLNRIGAAAKQALLCQIPEVVVTALPAPYPPLDHWAFEAESIRGKWETWLKTCKLYDKRNRRRPLFQVDKSKLAHDVGPSESRIFRDASGKIVGCVIRDFCPEKKVWKGVDEIVMAGVGAKKDIRVSSSINLAALALISWQLDDCGKIVLTGWSAGARNRTAFAWTKNNPPDMPKEKAAQQEYEISSIFALFWNIARNRLPGEILEDFDAFLSGICRMDSSSQAIQPDSPSQGKYTIKIAGQPFDFHTGELAPPAGILAKNYTRQVAACL